MSEVSDPMDLAFPMAEGPGAGADMARWRRMASLWSDDGVVRGVGNQFNFWGWVDGAPGTIAIGDGALWVNGFYAANEVGKWLLTPGDDGMIFAELLMAEQEVRIRFAPGAHGPPVHDPNGYWSLNLWELHGHGQPVTDRRFLIPPVPPPPPVTEIPAYVPRGYLASAVGPSTAVALPSGASTLVAWDSAGDGRFVPGRLYRALAYVGYMRASSQAQVYFYVSAGGYTERVAWVDPNGFDAWSGTASFRIRGEAGMNFWVWAQLNFGALTVPANSIRVDIEDAGI
jgi:hypothetical protein